ncbi:MAG: SIR2 family protein [Gammaproteobacteria bacterium]|nr:SIR2 family protein [Gammaproteobacteria bacterium]
MAKQIDQTKFLSLFCSRPQNFAWFLGAGTSRSAGLPTALDVIWDLKRRHYCREENQEITRQDVQNEAVRARIQSFMDSRGFPAEWSDDEYATYFEKIFGEDRERQRRYLRAMLSDERVTLSVGNRVLGALIASGLSRIVFTTNFDGVVEKSVAEVGAKAITAFHLEGSNAANQALNNEEFPIYCKLHGDFRYDSIKNLPADLARQNEELAVCLLNAGKRFGFVFAGYSGRDASIMNVLRNVLDDGNAFPHGLFWTGLKGSEVHPAVKSFLEEAEKAGVNARYVEVETFDTLMLRLWRNLEQKPVELNSKVCKTDTASVNIPLPATGQARPLLRFNALPVRKLPSRCLSLAFAEPKEWADLNEARHESRGQLVLTMANEVLCWGKSEEIKEQFGSDLQSVTERDLPSDFTSSENLYVKGFLGEALCSAIARVRPLLYRRLRSYAYLIVDSHDKESKALAHLSDVMGKTWGVVPGLFTIPADGHEQGKKVRWAEAARVSIDMRNDEVWLVIDPDIWIWPAKSRHEAAEFLSQRRKNRLNSKYNDLLSAWVQLIRDSEAPGMEVELKMSDAPVGASSPAFRLGSRTAFAKRLST